MKNGLTVYIDGSFKPVGQDGLKKLSPGVINGFGVFETLLCEKGKIHFLEEHYQRFSYGCDRYILPRPPSLIDIKKVLAQLLKENHLQNGRVRLSAWRKGYGVHFAVVVVPREAFSASVYREGFAACIYSKYLDRSPELAKIKSLDYRFFLDAYEYALHNDCHEALLLNSNGVLVEGSRSNVFLVKKKKLMTPALSCGCLSGVAREAVLWTAKREGIRTTSTDITLSDLHGCEEAFLTNSLIGIMPLTYLGEHKIGAGRTGPVTIRLTKGYKKLSLTRSDFLV